MKRYHPPPPFPLDSDLGMGAILGSSVQTMSDGSSDWNSRLLFGFFFAGSSLVGLGVCGGGGVEGVVSGGGWRCWVLLTLFGLIDIDGTINIVGT